MITAPVLRLDQDRDRTRLWETARRLRPRLLLLDPLVRLHGIDENRAGEVAELLAYFRSLQRELGLSVLLVHHTRKNAGDGVAAGQGLRGSGDIHAFGDSNLYLRRTEEHLILSSEHRAAPASSPVYLQLVVTDAATTHLEVIAEPASENGRGLEEQVLDLLAQGEVLTRTRLRDALAVNNERLGKALESLERAGRISRTPRAGKVSVDRHRASFRSPSRKGNGTIPPQRNPVSIILLRSLSIIATTLTSSRFRC